MRGRRNVLVGLGILVGLVGFCVLAVKMIDAEKADIDRICALPQITITVQSNCDLLSVIRKSVGEEIGRQYGDDLLIVAVMKLNPGKWGHLKPGMKLVIPTCPKGRRLRAGYFLIFDVSTLLNINLSLSKIEI